MQQFSLLTSFQFMIRHIQLFCWTVLKVWTTWHNNSYFTYIINFYSNLDFGAIISIVYKDNKAYVMHNMMDMIFMMFCMVVMQLNIWNHILVADLTEYHIYHIHQIALLRAQFNIDFWMSKSWSIRIVHNNNKNGHIVSSQKIY